MVYHVCGDFPEPKEGSVFYEDPDCYACLAFEPKTAGHTIVAVREHADDLDGLSVETYHHLMDVVLRVEQALKSIYGVPRVYIDFWNEIGHVHFHLFPRHEEGKRGPELLIQPGGELADFSKIPLLIAALRL